MSDLKSKFSRSGASSPKSLFAFVVFYISLLLLFSFERYEYIPEWTVHLIVFYLSLFFLNFSYVRFINKHSYQHNLFTESVRQLVIAVLVILSASFVCDLFSFSIAMINDKYFPMKESGNFYLISTLTKLAVLCGHAIITYWLLCLASALIVNKQKYYDAIFISWIFFRKMKSFIILIIIISLINIELKHTISSNLLPFWEALRLTFYVFIGTIILFSVSEGNL